jgi:DNA-binding CsgD family transcriptional regulator
MVAALQPRTIQFTEPTTALAKTLSELRVSERATSLALSVLVFIDDTFWVARRWTQDAASATSSGFAAIRDTTPSEPTRWAPPRALDPRGPRPRGLIDLDGRDGRDGRDGPAERDSVEGRDGVVELSTSKPCRAALVMSDRSVLGILELHGVRCGTPRSERADALMGRIGVHLAAWVATAPDPRTRLLIGPRGVCLQAPNTSIQSLPALAALSALRERPTRNEVRRIGLGLATVELEPLDGPAGPHMLVTVSRPSFFVVPQDLPLTSRQREVADLASHGLTIDEIAAATCCTPNTVKTHLKSVYRALGVANRIELRELLSDR